MSARATKIVEDIRLRRPFETREDEISGLADAYDIQAQVTRILLNDHPNRRIAGYKIAFNRRSSLDYYGLSEPCYAPLFSDQIHQSGAALPLSAYDDLVIEPEIAIGLRNKLHGSEDTHQLTGSIAALLPAIEIMDVRGAFARDPSAAAAIAQRIHSEGAILGEPVDMPSIDLGATVARLLIDDIIQAEAVNATPQPPLAALAWLSSRLARDGLPLEAGMIVMTGSHLPGHAIRQPCQLRVDLAPLGSVSANWV